MKITRITRQKRKKNLYSVYVDGAYTFSVTDENRVKFRLEEGNEVSARDIEGILSEDEKRRALDYAFTFLGIRSRSKRELIDRLRRQEYSEGSISHVIERLEELGYINDARFARDWMNALKDKGAGPELIRAELRKKGITSDQIQEVMTAYREDPEAEHERLKRMAERKLQAMKGVEPKAAARRLMGFLARKGFSIDAIRRVLRELRSAGDEDIDN